MSPKQYDKLLLIGPSSNIDYISKEWFVNKMEEGYCLISFSGSIDRLMEFNIKPHFYSFVDPNTIISWGMRLGKGDQFSFWNGNLRLSAKDTTLTQSDYFKDINLLIMDIYEKKLSFFDSLGWTCTGAKQFPEDFAQFENEMDDGTFYSRFKNVYKYKPEILYDVEQKFISIREADMNTLWKTSKRKSSTEAEFTGFIEHFDYNKIMLLHQIRWLNSDKLTAILFPLIFKHFGDAIKQIKVVGFGDMSVGRAGGINHSNTDSMSSYFKWFKKVIPYYAHHMLKKDIKFEFEEANEYSAFYKLCQKLYHMECKTHWATGCWVCNVEDLHLRSDVEIS